MARRCSQLSRTSRSCFDRNCSASVSAVVRRGSSGMASALATADGTRSGSDSGRQFHQPCTVGVPVQQVAGRLQRQDGTCPRPPLRSGSPDASRQVPVSRRPARLPCRRGCLAEPADCDALDQHEPAGPLEISRSHETLAEQQCQIGTDQASELLRRPERLVGRSVVGLDPSQQLLQPRLALWSRRLDIEKPRHPCRELYSSSKPDNVSSGATQP